MSRRSLIVILFFIFIFKFLATPTLITKPAIYLYPEKPTKVNITLAKTIKIYTNIPKYVPSKGWNVLAYPDGKIVDLQPRYTDCGKIDERVFGLEYAKKACIANNYPYIYWDGIQLLKLIPQKDEGWAVKTEQIYGFLNDKLSEIGFNKSEKQEFLNYWTKRLSNQAQKSYKIYFLQNEEVDEFLPIAQRQYRQTGFILLQNLWTMTN